MIRYVAPPPLLSGPTMTPRLLLLLLAVPALPAQRLPSPFRSPDVPMTLHPDLMREFRTMRRLVEPPAPRSLQFDAEGREASTDPEWEAARRRTLTALPRLAGDIAYIFHQSANPEDRATAAYALFFLEDLPRSVEATKLFAGEPVYEIRRRALARAIPFLEVQLRKTDGDKPLYAFDPTPFWSMLQSEVARDDALTLWFLARLTQIRPALRHVILAGAEPELRKVFTDLDRERLPWANDLLRAIDPQADERAVLDEKAAAEQRLAWLDAAILTLFPPIRRITDGLYELHPGKDRDELVRVGREALRQDAIGATVHGQQRNGQPYRGYRVARLPEPLDRIGLPVDAIVASINGQPVATAAELLELLEALCKNTDSLLVEFVTDGTRKAIEYRIRS